ncbi:hypothetical protein QJQ45_014870, partial [Haematococcus lacustris]
MPPVPKHTRANRANGAKAQAHHEAAKSMEQLTAAHAALTAAHAAVTADLLSSQQLYSQLRERHISLMVFAGQRVQQWELDLLGYMQQVTQLEEAFLQELQGTQAQLTDTAAALEAAQKGLAAARTELAHTKQQLTTTNSKLEQLRAQLDGCTIPAHGKVMLYRVTAAVRCFSPSPAAAAAPAPAVGSPSPAPAAAAGSPRPAPAPAVGSPTQLTHPAPPPTSNHAVESSLQHTKHGNSAKQGLDAMIGSINNKLDPGALANIDLADFEARLLTLRKQKRDKETTSADDNREAKAARKTEESACMVDGNAKMVLNVPTQVPLQQLQQAFQQHARGADYSNTSSARGLCYGVYRPAGYMQQVTQLEEAFLQELQGTQAQLTDTAAALEAAQKGLAAARTELAHTKQQLTTTNSKLEQLRAQLDGCTIPAHGKVMLYRVTAAVRCFSPSPAAAAAPAPAVGSPSPAPAAAAGSPRPAPAPAVGSPTQLTHPAPPPTSNHAVESSLQHTKHGNSAKQGLDAMIGSINNKLDPGALANIDLADFEARLLTLRKQKRDKETTSADDNREAKAARKTEESACMVDGNAKMVLNVPTQVPLQQLQQAFQQHARGADYSNTSSARGLCYGVYRPAGASGASWEDT